MKTVLSELHKAKHSLTHLENHSSTLEAIERAIELLSPRFTEQGSPLSLTYDQKLQALEEKYYLGVHWDPKPGDYYTSSRNDLELYQIIDIRDGLVHTRYCDQTRSSQTSQWSEEGFHKLDFGTRRVWVRRWILGLK